MSKAAKASHLKLLQGHELRIRVMLEYLLHGIPFEAIKAIGKWSSDVFYTYLFKHKQILAPFLQAVPSLYESVLRFTLAARRQ